MHNDLVIEWKDGEMFRMPSFAAIAQPPEDLHSPAALSSIQRFPVVTTSSPSALAKK